MAGVNGCFRSLRGVRGFHFPFTFASFARMLLAGFGVMAGPLCGNRRKLRFGCTRSTTLSNLQGTNAAADEHEASLQEIERDSKKVITL
jgi:hypothetical protein